MSKKRFTDGQKPSAPQRAPGNISWRKRHKDMKKHREKKLLKEHTKKQLEELEVIQKAEQEVTSDVLQKGRFYTLSIAVPGSIVDNAQSPELRCYLIGQIARAAAIFEVDEIIVFDESAQMTEKQAEMYRMSSGPSQPPNCNAKMMKILQYLECPQYLRKFLFPLQQDLQYAGILNPLDCPHHLRADDFSIPYREAIVLNKPTKTGKGSFCNAGLSREVQVDKELQPNIRVTIELKTFDLSKKKLKGVIVSPSTPIRQSGYYWGYSVRLANSLNAVFTECPYSEKGYDVVIGTSDRGRSVEEFEMPEFKHALIVFGGVKGIESCIENDQGLQAVESTSDLFHFYLNTCPNQGSRTIRTEEAILITLSALRSKIYHANDAVMP